MHAVARAVLLAVLLAVLGLSLAIAGCGGSQPSPGGGTPASTPSSGY